MDLATCGFIAKRRNVLLVGPSGVGKSHVAQAPGHRAYLMGHKVLYIAAHDMLKQLRAARGDGSHDRRLLRFTTPDLLIIDDLGLRPLAHDEPVDLYDIIRLRHERASTAITSNRALDELPSIFGDALLSTAAMDRLLDDAQVIVVEGDSHRNPPPATRRAKTKTRRTKGRTA